MEASTTALFQRIFEEEFDYVWSTLCRLGIHPRDAEDVAQELFVQVYRKLDGYDPSRPVRPWLFGFAVREAADYKRLARHRVEVLDEAETMRSASGDKDPEQSLATRDAQRLVSAALDTIPLERRAVLVAFELDQLPMKEIADALGLPLFTAYSRLRVAREELAEAIRRQQKEPSS